MFNIAVSDGKIFLIMQTYFVKKILSYENIFFADNASIECDNWLKGYVPKSFAKLGYDDEYIYVRMSSFEENIRAEIKERNGEVYTDSCLEFFFMPLVNGNDKYFNFEVNPIGTMLTAVGKERENRLFYTDGDKEFFKMKADTDLKSNNASFWEISYRIPLSLMKKYVGDFVLQKGLTFKGNFFKCGDKTDKPHFLSWSKIETENPDFHRPEFFSDIVFI